jgi:hypothetical protein
VGELFFCFGLIFKRLLSFLPICCLSKKKNKKTECGFEEALVKEKRRVCAFSCVHTSDGEEKKRKRRLSLCFTSVPFSPLFRYIFRENHFFELNDLDIFFSLWHY